MSGPLENKFEVRVVASLLKDGKGVPFIRVVSTDNFDRSFRCDEGQFEAERLSKGVSTREGFSEGCPIGTTNNNGSVEGFSFR
mmetsp:Transcript_27841/g.58087  ORF Transcript_27841/g.58087 Transcript_27841/m.58087 type:complete len:83 (+) Transcript_27841:338-586(+)